MAQALLPAALNFRREPPVLHRNGRQLGMSRHHNLRRSDRLPVYLVGRCKSRSGKSDDVIISDITAHGCSLTSRITRFKPGQPVLLRPESLELVCGTVRWASGIRAGIEFDKPIYEPVLDHLVRRFPAMATDSPGEVSQNWLSVA